ncbi:hypothetical protein [Actinoplanes sp. DH11]|uniref:hypothetical protein n=1 Tax=Actinoplanes sp. DH11 TaxID=2857011 RepID=UPI001E5E609E|nr:hypothetical protein [Actinoplanes sp. DH11]
MPNWEWWELSARILFGLLALVLAAYLFLKRRGKLAREEAAPTQAAYPFPKFLDSLWTEGARRITSESVEDNASNGKKPVDSKGTGESDYLRPIAIFTELIMNVSKHRVRVAETVDVEGHMMVQRVIVEFDLPRGWEQAKFLYLPVLHPVKGELVDNFHLRDAQDSSLTDLTYEETTRLAAAGLRLLMAFGDKAVIAAESESVVPPVAAEASTEWPDAAMVAKEKDLLTLLAMRGPVDIEPMQRTINEILETFEVDDLTKGYLRRYVLELCGAYPIVAVVDPQIVAGGRVLIKYERTLMPASVTAAAGSSEGPPARSRRAKFGVKRWRGLMRIGMGLRPAQVAVPISLALTASSYHLRLNAPESKYVFEQHLTCSHCDQLVTPSWVGSRPGVKRGPVGTAKCTHKAGVEPSAHRFDDRHYFRLQRRHGQNFVHLYMRGFGAAKPKMHDLQVVARFKEVPPGSRLQAAVTAFATTVLVIVVGYMVSNHRVAPESDYPAVILALPAVVASWFGIASERNALVGGSLLARLSLIVSGVLSIASIVTYLMTAPTEAGSSPPPPQVSLLGVTHKAWIALSLLSLVNFVYIYYRFVLKLIHYRDLMRRKQGHGSTMKIA